MSLKPICEQCGERCEQSVYIWIPNKRGKEGKLVHAKCMDESLYWMKWNIVVNKFINKFLK